MAGEIETGQELIASRMVAPGQQLSWQARNTDFDVWNTTAVNWRDEATGAIGRWPGAQATANFTSNQNYNVQIDDGGIEALTINAVAGGYTLTGGNIVLPRGTDPATLSGPSVATTTTNYLKVQSDIVDGQIRSIYQPATFADMRIQGYVQFLGSKSYAGNTYIEPESLLLVDLDRSTPNPANGYLRGAINFRSPQNGFPAAFGSQIIFALTPNSTYRYTNRISASSMNSIMSFNCFGQGRKCNIDYHQDNSDFEGTTYCFGCNFNITSSAPIGGSLSNSIPYGIFDRITIRGAGSIGSQNRQSSFLAADIITALAAQPGQNIVFPGDLVGAVLPVGVAGDGRNQFRLGFSFFGNNTSQVQVMGSFVPAGNEIDVVVTGTLTEPRDYVLATFGGIPNGPPQINLITDTLTTQLQTEANFAANGEGFNLVLSATQH
nr:hypothetical protein [Marinicella sp. W31]MDC2876173.1 hypothetical protein [Marinicella sp. W31]